MRTEVDVPHGRIVGLCEVKGRVFVATEERVYELVDGLWHPMVFADKLEGAGGGPVTDG